MMNSFVGWAKVVNGDIHCTEYKIISRKYRYSGTLDAVGTFEGKPMLYDWKTSSSIYRDMDLQLAAYAQAYKEETGIDLKQGMIVHVSKDKPRYKLTAKVFKLGKAPLKRFLKLREMFDEMQQVSLDK
jgi:CRISPR/Cas system-associated exonuclease Cas4 (RecB family)